MDSKEYIKAHKKYILPSTIDEKESEVLIRGDGVWVWTESGRKYFDLCSQVSCANIGHNHTTLTKGMRRFWDLAVKKKVISVVMGTDFFHNNRDFYKNKCFNEYSPVALTEKLSPHIFGSGKTEFAFDISGAQSVNNPTRYFRTVTGKPYRIAFEKGFHGRHGESRDSSSSKPIHWNEAPRSEDVYFLPYPETYWNLDQCMKQLNDIPLKECSSFIYEPVQGEGGGMRVGWQLPKIEKVLKKEGLFSISDEIQAGLGRCGTWWGYQKLGLDPDCIVMGKSLGSGHPVSAAAFKKEITDSFDLPPGKISGTFPMYPVGMAAANLTIKIFEEEKLVENAEKLSLPFSELLRNAISPFNIFGADRVTFVIDGLGLYRSLKPYGMDNLGDIVLRDKILWKLRDLGFLTIPASESYPAIRLTPPLISTVEDLKGVAEAIYKVTRPD